MAKRCFLTSFCLLLIDFVEEEITEALQKDRDPNLAGVSVGNTKSDCLELLFPMIGNEEDMLVLNKPFMSAAPIPDEIVDFDQGVAMESDHPRLHSSVFSDCESVSYDLPFSSPPPTATSSTFDPINSPHFVQCSNSFNYSQINSPSQSLVASSSLHLPTPPPPPSVSDNRQNSELDLICSVLQSDDHQPHTTCSPMSQYTGIPIDTTSGLDLLNVLNSSVPEEPFANFNSFPGSLIMGTEQFKPNDVLPSVLPVSSSIKTSQIEMNCHSSKQAKNTRQRSPTPSLSLPAPSPVSSVTTEYPDSEYGRDTNRSVRPRDEASDGGDIVNMPFYEFKKILDSSGASERDKEQVKAIRKRGKNKVAAKNCRQRKLEVIMGLQEEVDKLKGLKAQLLMKSLALQRSIEENKQKVYRSTHSLSRGILQPSTIVH